MIIKISDKDANFVLQNIEFFLKFINNKNPNDIVIYSNEELGNFRVSLIDCLTDCVNRKVVLSGYEINTNKWYDGIEMAAEANS